MLCVGCGSSTVVLDNLCKQCFTTAIHRRVRKWAKQHDLFQPKEPISLPKGNDLEAVATRAIFEHAIKTPHIISEEGKQIEAWSLDHELEERLAAVLRSKQRSSGTRLLTFVTRQEMRAYCKAHNLKFSEPAEDSAESKLVKQLCRDDPSLKFGLLKSFEVFS